MSWTTEDWKAACQEVSPEIGGDWRAVYALGLLESGYLGNDLTHLNNNVVAIKWPVGPYHRAEVPDNSEGPFASYPDLAACVRDFWAFVNPENNPRYAAAWGVRGWGPDFLRELDLAGYSDGQYKVAPGPYYYGIMRVWAQEGLDAEPATPGADWRSSAIEEARAAGLLSAAHPVGSSVEIEELAVVALRLQLRIADLEARLVALEGQKG